MQKLSQTEELARSLAAKAHRHTLTTEQISRAMEEAILILHSWTSFTRRWSSGAFIWQRRSLPSCLCWMMPRSAGWRMNFPQRA